MLALFASTGLAQTRTSTDYAIATDTLNSAGARQSSADYKLDTSLDAFGMSGVFSGGNLKQSYIAQLMDPAALNVRSATPSVSELGTLQFSVTALLDDASWLPLANNLPAWSVESGAFSSVNGSGLATAGIVPFHTNGTVRATFEGATGTNQVAVFDVNYDNYGSYAGDGISDDWQARNFGLNNPDAAPGVDADGDGLTNLQEFQRGTNPTLADTDGDGLPDNTDPNPTGALTSVVTSADYQLMPFVMDAAGSAGATADYQSIGSVSDIGSAINAASTDTTLWNGFVGQLFETAVALPSGPVAWWRAENNALDTFGGHNGTLWNGAGFAPGLVSQAFSFNGSTQYVAVASAPGVTFGSTSPMTVELWAYRTGSGTVMHLVSKRSGCSGANSTINYQLAFNSTSGEGLNFGAGFGNEAASGVELPMNTWTYVAGTFDGTAFRIYVNGVLTATQAGTLGPENSAPLVIGGSGTCDFFVGRLDEVTLYDRALSAPEILAIFNAGASGKATDAPVITTLATLAGGRINTPYAQTLAATLGTPPYTFTPVGPMPPGLTFSSAGEIGGAPTFFGNASFTARVTDAAGKSSTKVFSLYVLPYSGNVYTWNNSGGDWSDATRWIPNGVPGPNDFATINNGYVIVNADQAVAQLNFTGGEIRGAATLTVNGLLNWTGGSMGWNVMDPPLSGTTLIAAGAECRVGSAAGALLTARTLENAGTLIWTGSGNFSLLYGAVITNRAGALFEVQNDAALQYGGGADTRFDNAGTFRKSTGTGTNTLTLTFINYGTNEVETGTLLFNSTFNSYGRVDVAAGATNRLAGGGTASGTFAVANGGLVDFSASAYSFNAGVQLTGTGFHRVSGGSLSVNGSAVAENLVFTGGEIRGAATLTVNGLLNWTGGSMGWNVMDPPLSGTTLIAAGAECRVGSAAGALLTARTLENAGTLIWTGSGNFSLLYGAVITNRAGALFEVQNDAALQYGGGADTRFDNAGTFLKSAGTGTTTLALTFNNYGTMDIRTGVLLPLAAFNVYGPVTVAALARVDYTTGVINLKSGAQLLGAGLHRVSGGALSVSGDVIAQNLELIGGEIRGAATLTVNGLLNWTGGSMGWNVMDPPLSGTTLIAAGAECRVGSAAGVLLTARTLENAGTLIWTGTGYLGLLYGAVITNRAGALFEVQNDAALQYGGGGVTRFDNAGMFRKSPGILTTTVGGVFKNYGVLDVASGTVSFVSPLQNLGGVIMGKGTIAGTVNNNGLVSPGASPGQLTIAGGFSQSASGVLDIELSGNTPGISYDLLSVGGAATLGGTLRVTLTDDFYPNTNALFTFLTTASRSGSFASFYYPSNDVGLKVTNTATSFSVEVINVRPVLAAIPDQTNDEMTVFSYLATATDDDRPAQTLIYSLTNSPAGASINPSTGQITWTPTEAQGPMTTNITVRVTDNGVPNLTVSRTFAIVINEVNVAPVLTLPADQAFNEETTLTNHATATDSDIPTNSPLVFELVSGPPGLTVSTNGDIAWTPTEAQGSNSYTVTIRVTDTNQFAVNEKQLSTTNSFTLTVNEVNRPPQLTVPADQVVTEETALNVPASATDPDLPPNGLSFTLLSPPTGMTIDSASGAISWTPNESQGSNNYTVMVVVTDDSPMAVNAIHLSATNTFQVTVNESNRPPVLSVPSNQVVTEENLLSVSASATDPDVPANPLTFALVSPPSGMTIDPNTGAINWTPTEAQGSNAYTITVTVTDTNTVAINEKQLSVTNTFTVSVNESNRPPVLTVPGPQILNELTTLTVTNTATDPDLPANTRAFTLLSPPSGMTIDAASGVINWTPNEAQGSNTFIITVSVTDTNANAINATSLSDTKNFVVTVNESNSPPVLTLPGDTTINELAPYSANASATDSDEPVNPRTFALVSGPTGLTVSPSGAVAWTPDETQGPTTNMVTIRVTDTNLLAVNATSLSVTGSYQLIVTEVNVAPVLGALSNYTVNPGQTVNFTATATDADVPANLLSFILLSPPAGATITSGGLFNWRPGVALRNTTNTIQLRVQDNGAPVSNDTRSFSVIVNPLAAPVVLTPLGFANGQFTLSVTGPLGPDYVIMASTNLAHWSDLVTNLSPTLPFQHTDTEAGSFGNRVYRVRLSP